MAWFGGRWPDTRGGAPEPRMRHPHASPLGAVVAGLGAIVAICGPALAQSDGATPATSTDPAAVIAIAEEVMAEHDLRGVILSVTVDDEELVTEALGESMTGVPATTDMHFRNGAVAISYVATVALQLAEEGVIGLDDTIDRWLPELPLADEVTVRMLMDMTSGYPDYVEDEGFLDALQDDPFRAWTPEELIAIGMAGTRHFEPGTNWTYAHTNYVILGRVLEAATGRPMVELIRSGCSIRSASRTRPTRARPRSPSRCSTPSRPSVAATSASQPAAVLRGVDLLGPVVDDHGGSHPDDRHPGHDHDRGGDRRGRAPLGGFPCRAGLRPPDRLREHGRGLPDLSRARRALRLWARRRAVGLVDPPEPGVQRLRRRGRVPTQRADRRSRSRRRSARARSTR